MNTVVFKLLTLVEMLCVIRSSAWVLYPSSSSPSNTQVSTSKRYPLDSSVSSTQRYHHYHQATTVHNRRFQNSLLTMVMQNGDGVAASASVAAEDTTSLAGDYAILISDQSWSFYSIEDVMESSARAKRDLETSSTDNDSDDSKIIEKSLEGYIADGARANYALYQTANIVATTSTTSTSSNQQLQPKIVLTCDHVFGEGELKMILSSPSSSSSSSPSDVINDDGDLLSLLQRIMIQQKLYDVMKNSNGEKRQDKEWKIHLLSGEMIMIRCRNDDDDDDDDHNSSIHVIDDTSLRKLYSTMIGDSNDDDSIEWVEMVTGTGKGLGKVPRKFVHKFNLLHRGIGMFVTKDVPMPIEEEDNNNDQNVATISRPDLYVHRRCASKRIFPSLYDMFVGGVSLADESPELTARREVAEELGLMYALDESKKDKLSSKILDCVVCTAYNRCYVSLYSYTMDSTEENITWQEEEVDWGHFIPYQVIVASADRSIQRFAKNNNQWPGTYPPVQSTLRGTLNSLDDIQQQKQLDNDDWKEWDYVPDGLLVWEAWLKHIGSNVVGDGIDDNNQLLKGGKDTAAMEETAASTSTPVS